MISIGAAIESNLRDSLLNRPLGKSLPDSSGSITVATKTSRKNRLLNRGGRDKSCPGDIIDDLGVDMLVAAEDGEPETTGRSHTVLDTETAPSLLLCRSLDQLHFNATQTRRYRNFD